MAKKPIKITETVLRDAHQSLLATRMPLSDMLPILGKMDKVGYYSAEVWGGATFGRLHPLPERRPLGAPAGDPQRDAHNTKLQMLFRGQNMLGYRPYADDVVEYFVQKSIANGIDIIRIFDAPQRHPQPRDRRQTIRISIATPRSRSPSPSARPSPPSTMSTTPNRSSRLAPSRSASRIWRPS